MMLRMIKRIAVNMSLPKDLVELLDEVAGVRNRSAFVEAAVREQLRRERIRRAWEEVRGAWAGKGPAEWDEPDGVANWVRALRAEETNLGDEAAA
jgi:predicted transcriptional regulator